MASKLVIFTDNTTVITIPSVTDAVTGLPITNATITATLYTPAGVAVIGYVNLLMLNAGSPPTNSYTLTLAANPDLAVGSYYFLFVGTTDTAGFELTQWAEIRIRT